MVLLFRRLHFVVLLLLLSFSTPRTAAASSERDPAYRALITAALEAYGAGRLPEAKASFAQAHQRYPNARTLRGLGLVELDLGDYVAAATHLQDALNAVERPLDDKLRAEVEGALAEAKKHVFMLRIFVLPSQAEVSVDGRVVAQNEPFPLAPGTHVIEAAAEGHERKTHVIAADAATAQLVSLTLVPAHVQSDVRAPEPESAAGSPTPASGEQDLRPPTRRWPLYLIAISGVAAMAGVGLFAAGFRDLAALHDRDGASFRSWERTESRYPVLMISAGVLLGSGLAGLVTGLRMRGAAEEARAARELVSPMARLAARPRKPSHMSGPPAAAASFARAK